MIGRLLSTFSSWLAASRVQYLSFFNLVYFNEIVICGTNLNFLDLLGIFGWICGLFVAHRPLALALFAG